MSKTIRSRWAIVIYAALAKLGGKASLARIYDKVEELHPGPLPKTWEAIVRGTIESHSSDSENYDPVRADLFYSVEGKGQGVWGIR
jgi:hypothetical protein